MAFDVTAIIQNTPLPIDRRNAAALAAVSGDALKVGFYVIPDQGATGDTLQKSSQAITSKAASAFLPLKTTIPPLQIISMGLRAVFSLWIFHRLKGLAFDFGTSPHGLPASLREALRKLAGRSGRALSAKPVLSLGGVL